MQTYKVIVLFLQIVVFIFSLSHEAYSRKIKLSLELRKIAILNFRELSPTKETSLPIALSFFLTEGLSFIKNIDLVSNETMQYVQGRYKKVRYNKKSLRQIAEQIKVDYIIYGNYSLRGRNIRLSLNMFDLARSKQIKLLSLELSLDKFSELVERLVIAIANSFDFADQIVFEKESLATYTRASPKTLHYLKFFVKSYEALIHERLYFSLSYAKELESLFSKDINLLFIIADNYLAQGDLSAALAYYKSLFKLCKASKLRAYFCRAALKIANIYNKQGRYKKAIRLYDKVLSLAVSANVLTMKSKALRGLGKLYELKGEYTLASRYYYNALTNDRLNRDSAGKAMSLFFMAKLLYSKGEYTKAFANIYRVIDIHKRMARQKELIDDYILLASIISSLGDITESLSVYKYASKIANSLELPLVQARLLAKKASMMELEGRIGLAEKYINEAVKIQEKYKSLNATSYSILGLIYYNKGQFKKALLFYHKALEINKNISFKSSIAKDYSNIASLYLEIEDYKKAFYYYNKALKIRKEIDDKLGIAITKNALALIYINKDNDYEKALDIYFDSIAMMQQIDYKEGLALSYWMIGNIYAEKESYKRAIHYYIKCQNIFIKIGNPNHKNMELLIEELDRKIQEGKEELSEENNGGSE